MMTDARLKRLADLLTETPDDVRFAVDRTASGRTIWTYMLWCDNDAYEVWLSSGQLPGADFVVPELAGVTDRVVALPIITRVVLARLAACGGAQ